MREHGKDRVCPSEPIARETRAGWTHPCTEPPARTLFGSVVHALHVEVYSVRGELDIVCVYKVFVLGIFRLDGNVHEPRGQRTPKMRQELIGRATDLRGENCADALGLAVRAEEGVELQDDRTGVQHVLGTNADCVGGMRRGRVENSRLWRIARVPRLSNLSSPSVRSCPCGPTGGWGGGRSRGEMSESSRARGTSR